MNSKFKDICHTCGGYGREGGCPSCGLTPQKRVVARTMHLDVPADVIPLTYQGKLWAKPEIDNNTPMKFVDFDTKLEKVFNEFMAGRIPKFSMFIASPAKYGKHMFAYSCLQTALAQGHSIAPMFNTSDWRRLYRVSQMNPFYKLFDKYRWDDVVKRDVIFLDVDHSDDRYDVVGLLKDILDTRARFNLPTFIVSDYKLTELVSTWQKKEYNIIYNPDPQRDLLRYPVIIQRFE